MKKPYTDIHLQKYAEIFVNFALEVKPNKSVLLNVPESARDFLPFLYKSVLLAGAFPIVNFQAEGLSKIFYENASNEKIIVCNIDEIPTKYRRNYPRLDFAYFNLHYARYSKQIFEAVEKSYITYFL